MKKSTLTKVGITLACSTLLGGVVVPVAVPAFRNVVHAEETNQQQPISVAVIAISETDGPLSHHYITINPGETKTIDAPKVEGWKLDQYTNPTYELTYDQALKTLNSAGFVWVQFWMIKDVAPTTKEPVIFTVAHRVAGGDDLLLDNAVVNPGESITLAPIAVDGYIVRADNKYTYTYDEVATGSSSLFVAEIFYDKVAVEQPAETPVETPAEQPVETPTDQPVETPTEKPVEQPVEKPAETPAEQPVFHPYVVEFYIDGEYWGAANRGYNSGWPYVRLAPYSEEFPGKEWPKEELDGRTSNLPNVSVVTKEDLDSIGGVVKVYWTRKPAEVPVEQPTEKPAEQPAETPTDQPVEQPVEQPAETPTDQPTEKPTATSILAGNTASKAQTGATADKKKVDNSTPSTTAVKPEEGSQTTAKTLPKTGDSSSMHLVLGGLLSGLSGLGLAAPSRKRD